MDTMSTIYQNRYLHLRDIIERHGGQSAVALKIGISRQLMSNMAAKSPVKTIGSRMARKIESSMGLPVGHLDSPLNEDKSPAVASLSVDVPVLNVTASMGPGAVMPWHEEAIHTMRVSKDWIRKNTQASSFERLAIITARGDSMEPTFTDGSVLLVDTSITAIKLDAVYVILKGDSIYIKRVQCNMDGTLDIISDNQKYKVQSIANPLKEGFLVMGRVLISWNPYKL